MPDLLGTEDFGRFESLVASKGKSLPAGATAACSADFDASLRALAESCRKTAAASLAGFFAGFTLRGGLRSRFLL